MLNNPILGRWVDSPAWFRAFIGGTVLCIVVYIANLILSEIKPGNVWGLTYGTLATTFMVWVAFYGIRRRKIRFFSRAKLGRSQAWVQFHIYGGWLFMLLVFMHIGFKLPSGPLNWWLWSVSIWVTLSGMLGVVIQKLIPRMMSSGLTIEVVYERIPELIEEIKSKAAELVKSGAEPIQDLYDKTVSPALTAPNVRLSYFIDITGGIQSRVRQFDFVRKTVAGEDLERLRQLESMYRTKLELDAHFTLQRALRWWLYTHVPASLLLLALVAVHLYAVFVY